MATLDEIAPIYIGERRLKLTRTSTEEPRAFASIAIAVAVDPAADTDGLAARVGLVLPLEMTVTSPSSSGYRRQVFTRAVPSEVSFTPQEGGEHLVKLRELGHNRWWGALLVVVSGERSDPRASA